ncbi:hypothetical protein PVNG_05769 [Plasmodium vivax North Korean]|uniref:Plasmodium RESA N-terminal domain-containing protein n=1 Tax=Plasmodium vivax North Korean TaxID=1035514 RepID=A0A0J9U3H6_PLAVI|nr:hypothetical protein PVNG_05769 [Plasmodium vivax North Korean]
MERRRDVRRGNRMDEKRNNNKKDETEKNIKSMKFFTNFGKKGQKQNASNKMTKGSRTQNIVDSIMEKLELEFVNPTKREHFLRKQSTYSTSRDSDGEADDSPINPKRMKLLHTEFILKDLPNNVQKYPFFSRTFKTPMNLSDKKLLKLIYALNESSKKQDVYYVWKLFRWAVRNKYVRVLDELWTVYKELPKNSNWHDFTSKKQWRQCYDLYMDHVRNEETYFNKKFVSMIEGKNANTREVKRFLASSLKKSQGFVDKMKYSCQKVLGDAQAQKKNGKRS